RAGGEFTEVSNAALSGLSSSDSGAQLLSADGTVVEASDDLVAREPMISRTQLAEVLDGRTLLVTGRLAGSPATLRVLARSVPDPGAATEGGCRAETSKPRLDRLEAGVEAQRRLIADASHDLRTPLAVMRSELEVALAAGDLAPEAAEVLASTAEEVERMSRIVGNLLALAQFDQGALELFVRPVDLRDVAEATAATLRPLAAAKGLTIEVT